MSLHLAEINVGAGRNLNKTRSISSRMTTLFLKLHILDSTAEEDSKTMTQVVLQQAMASPVIHYGPRVHYLWTSTSKNEVKDCCLSLFAVVQTALSRVSSELQGLQFDFAAFDLYSLHEAVLQGDFRNYEILTNTRLRRLLKQGLRNAEPEAMIRTFWGAAFELVEVHKAELSRNPDFDNRAAWSGIVSSPCPLASLVNFYLGFLDGSNVCERSLGRMSKLKQQHLGPLEEDGITISMLLELYEDGPQSETGLATRNVCSDVFDRDHVFLEPTDFLIDCGQLWRQKFGSRFKLYKTRSDIGKSRAKQSGSLVSLRRAQASAADTLAAKASSKSGEDTTIFDGLKRKHLPDTVSLEQNPKFNDKLKDLRAMDQRRQQRHQVLAQRRKQLPRGSPFQVGQVRRAKLVSDVGSNDTGRAFYASRSTLRVVDIRPQPVQLSKKHGSQTLDVWRPASSSSLKDALARVKQCHLLLVEKDSHLHTSPRATVFLANMVI